MCVRYYYYLGLATYMKGDVEEAIKLYQGTIDLDTQRRLEKEEKRSTISVDGNEDSDNEEVVFGVTKAGTSCKRCLKLNDFCNQHESQRKVT